MGPAPFALTRGDELLGVIEELHPGVASGWFDGALAPAAAWGAVAALFAAEATAVAHADRWPDAWQAAWDLAQGPGLHLVDATGRRTAVDARINGVSVQLQERTDQR